MRGEETRYWAVVGGEGYWVWYRTSIEEEKRRGKIYENSDYVTSLEEHHD